MQNLAEETKINKNPNLARKLAKIVLLSVTLFAVISLVSLLVFFLVHKFAASQEANLTKETKTISGTGTKKLPPKTTSYGTWKMTEIISSGQSLDLAETETPYQIKKVKTDQYGRPLESDGTPINLWDRKTGKYVDAWGKPLPSWVLSIPGESVSAPPPASTTNTANTGSSNSGASANPAASQPLGSNRVNNYSAFSNTNSSFPNRVSTSSGASKPDNSDEYNFPMPDINRNSQNTNSNEPTPDIEGIMPDLNRQSAIEPEDETGAIAPDRSNMQAGAGLNDQTVTSDAYPAGGFPAGSTGFWGSVGSAFNTARDYVGSYFQTPNVYEEAKKRELAAQEQKVKENREQNQKGLDAEKGYLKSIEEEIAKIGDDLSEEATKKKTYLEELKSQTEKNIRTMEEFQNLSKPETEEDRIRRETEEQKARDEVEKIKTSMDKEDTRTSQSTEEKPPEGEIAGQSPPLQPDRQQDNSSPGTGSDQRSSLDESDGQASLDDRRANGLDDRRASLDAGFQDVTSDATPPYGPPAANGTGDRSGNLAQPADSIPAAWPADKIPTDQEYPQEQVSRPTEDSSGSRMGEPASTPELSLWEEIKTGVSNFFGLGDRAADEKIKMAEPDRPVPEDKFNGGSTASGGETREPMDYEQTYNGNGTPGDPFEIKYNGREEGTDLISEVFDYDPETGEVVLKKDWQKTTGFEGKESRFKLPKKEDVLEALEKKGKITKEQKEESLRKDPKGIKVPNGTQVEDEKNQSRYAFDDPDKEHPSETGSTIDPEKNNVVSGN